MGTNCLIGKDNGNEIKAIYCHFDGYIAGVGRTLKEHYTDEDKIDKLILLGAISYLAPNLDFNSKNINKSFKEIGMTIKVEYKDRKIRVSDNITPNISEVTIFDCRYKIRQILQLFNYGNLTDEMENYLEELKDLIDSTTMAFHRDRGEPLKILEFRNEKEFSKADYEYKYLYKNGLWLMTTDNENFEKF